MNQQSCIPSHKTAILIDGGFYRKKANSLWGKKDPDKRANELYDYAMSFIKGYSDGGSYRNLYRIFYYDCPPTDEMVYHPLLQENIDYKKEYIYSWTLDFFDALRKKRKMALRLGKLSSEASHFQLSPTATKKLLRGSISLDDLTTKDFSPTFKQKGVDMRIGVDITSLAYEGLIDQIILIAGDSDFVPAAKLARRKGIDFILDPLGQKVNKDLFEHIDGLESRWKETCAKNNRGNDN